MRPLFRARISRSVALLSCAAVAALTTAATTATASASSSGAPPPQVPIGIVDALESFGSQQVTDVYGGLALDDKGSALHVYLTAPSAELESPFQTLAAIYPIVFSATHTTATALDALNDKLRSEWQTLIQSGVDVNRFWPDVRTGIEQIGVHNMTGHDIDALNQQYGADNIAVFNVTDEQLRSFDLQARVNDSRPWNASDVIWGHIPGGAAGCTLGYGIEFNSSHAFRILTAGHCQFNIGSTVYNAAQGNFTDTSRPVGSAASNDIGNNVDGELINSQSSDFIWLGPIGPSTFTAYVVGSLNNVVGAQVCSDGGYGGEICGMTVQAANSCFTISPYYICHEDMATPPTASAHTIDGDSGGPWIEINGGDVYAVGIHTGWDGQYEYYSGINALLNYYNASICSVNNPYC
jgi:hypothetical protein